MQALKLLTAFLVPVIMIVFHLSEMAGQTGQSVNRMRHYEGMVMQIFKNKHSENGSCHKDKIYKSVYSVCKLTSLAGQC